MSSSSTKIWIEGAIAASLAMVLSFVPVKFGPGFSVSLGMIALILFALRRGLGPGLVAGLSWGLLHFLLGKVTILSIPQALIEYVFAYLAAGLAGVYSSKIKTALQNDKSKQLYFYLVQAVLLGTLARYIFHFIAGFVFWGQYAIAGLSPVAYSLLINGTNAILTGIVTIIAMILLMKKSPALFLPRD